MRDRFLLIGALLPAALFAAILTLAALSRSAAEANWEYVWIGGVAATALALGRLRPRQYYVPGLGALAPVAFLACLLLLRGGFEVLWLNFPQCAPVFLAPVGAVVLGYLAAHAEPGPSRR